MAKKKIEDWVLKDYLRDYDALYQEQQPWRSEAVRVSSYIIPGRGVFNNLARPAKKKLTSMKVVNPIAREAMKVLTSGLQGWLTSPLRPWFKFEMADPMLNQHPVIARWMYDVEKRMYAALAESNFYQSIHSFYTEFAGFGTAPMYVGEDGDPFRFEVLTFGEYVIGVNSKGLVDRFYRVLFRTGQMLLDDYEDKLQSPLVDNLRRNQGLNEWHTCLECTVPRKYQDKPFTKVMYLLDSSNLQKNNYSNGKDETGCILELSGVYEFPYPTARWDIIGSDIYGIGPGIESLPDVMRLQEMEMSGSMAVHKDVSPPLFVPAHLKGKLKTLPGALNYSRNTMNEKITSIYDRPFDYKGVMGYIERVEQRIQRVFFNDIFLTASRDPNASPLKATEVQVKEGEKNFRLGPMVERTFYEFLQPLLTRCFNIMLRKNKFAALDPATMQLLSGAEFKIKLVSVLAQAQKAIGAQPIEKFLQFVGGVSQVKPEVLDKVDFDALVDETADITGVPVVIMRDAKGVMQIRQQRAQQQAQAQQAQMQMMQRQMQNETGQAKAKSLKDLSSAGINAKEVMQGEQVPQ